MQEMVGGNKNPNCLILDEIDGALPAAISVLVELVKATGNAAASSAASKAADEDDAQSATTSGPAKGKGKKRAQPLLRRPIICICNDVNAPALKPLKEHALCLVLSKVCAVFPSRACAEKRLTLGCWRTGGHEQLDGAALADLR